MAPLTSDVLILPDLASLTPFPLVVNPSYISARKATDVWIDRSNSSRKGLNPGLLGAMCYPLADAEALQVVADFLNFLFHCDDLTDEMGTTDAGKVREAVVGVMYEPEKFEERLRNGESVPSVSRLAHDLFSRIARRASPLARHRFLVSFDDFFKTVQAQAGLRTEQAIPDLETYILRRRENVGVRACFALVEYAADIEVPEDVFTHPAMRRLDDLASDILSLGNDIVSYNQEQARGDNYNIVAILRDLKNLSHQQALDRAGEIYRETVERFTRERAQLPHWGAETDAAVSLYLDGLEYGIAGNVHWSFETTRYFGHEGLKVKATRCVPLLPPKRRAVQVSVEA